LARRRRAMQRATQITSTNAMTAAPYSMYVVGNLTRSFALFKLLVMLTMSDEAVPFALRCPPEPVAGLSTRGAGGGEDGVDGNRATSGGSTVGATGGSGGGGDGVGNQGDPGGALGGVDGDGGVHGGDEGGGDGKGDGMKGGGHDGDGDRGGGGCEGGGGKGGYG